MLYIIEGTRVVTYRRKEDEEPFYLLPSLPDTDMDSADLERARPLGLGDLLAARPRGGESSLIGDGERLRLGGEGDRESRSRRGDRERAERLGGEWGDLSLESDRPERRRGGD